MIDQTPEGLLRAWAKAYRDTPEHRFPSDPDAEFFPVDLEYAANEIERLRGVAQPSPRCDVCGSGDTMTICEGCWTRQPLQRPLAYRLDHPAMGIELSISEPDKDWAARGWIVTPLVASPAQSSWQPIATAPKDGSFLVCAVGDDRGAFVVSGNILATARKANTPSHLGLSYLTHWMPLPAGPSLSSTEPLPPDWKQDQAETSRLAPRVSSTEGK